VFYLIIWNIIFPLPVPKHNYSLIKKSLVLVLLSWSGFRLTDHSDVTEILFESAIKTEDKISTKTQV